MKRRMITFIFAAVCASLLLLPAFAATVQSGKCGDGVSWKLDTAGLLTISGTGAMKNYAVYNEVPWYNRRASVKSVSVNSGVTAIGDLAFNLCEELTAVSIADSVVSIGEYAFSNCKKLQTITLPDKVTSIGIAAFYQCSGLTGVSIPSGVTKIANETFAYCTGVTSVTIPNTVKQINEDAFLLCKALTSVTIPDSVTYVGESAFQQCSKLQKVIFGRNLSSISYCAFYSCSNLRSIVFTGNAPTIKSDSFKYCSGAAYYPESNQTWTADKKQDYGGNLSWAPLTCDVLGRAHTPVVDEAIAPGCVESGLTEGSHCSACGKILSKQAEIPAAGHTYQTAFSWADDLSAASVSAVCSCGESHRADCALSWDAATPNRLVVTASALVDGTACSSVKEITAVSDGDGLAIVLPNEIPGLMLAAAVHGGDGRMTCCEMPDMIGTRIPLTVGGGSTRVFFLGNGYCPMMPAMSIAGI